MSGAGKKRKGERRKAIAMCADRSIGKEINGGDYASETSHRRLAIASKVFKGDAIGRTLAEFLMRWARAGAKRKGERRNV